METLKLVYNAAKPQSFMGIAGMYAGVGVLGFAVMYLPGKWLFWHHEQKYRETVCWDSYKAGEVALLQPELYSEKEYFRRLRTYKKCISDARNSKSL